MHLRDGILSPEVCLATAALSLVAVGWSLRQLRADLHSRAVPLTGMMAAMIFAGQMINFPLFGLPVSGHLMGGVLAAVVVGPWAGCLALTVVLVLQALLFSDGGLLSLGANILNMAVVGSWGGYAIYKTLTHWLGRSPMGLIVAAMGAAWLSVLASATVFCLEFSLSRTSATFDLGRVVMLMTIYHAMIGVGEALITGGVVSFLAVRRPELLHAQFVEATFLGTVSRILTTGLVGALAVAAFVAPFASEWPDGLEAVGDRLGFNQLAVDNPTLVLPDYEIPLPPDLWPGWSVSLAGVLGTLAVLGVTLLLAQTARWRSSGGEKMGVQRGV